MPTHKVHPPTSPTYLQKRLHFTSLHFTSIHITSPPITNSSTPFRHKQNANANANTAEAETEDEDEVISTLQILWKLHPTPQYELRCQMSGLWGVSSAWWLSAAGIGGRERESGKDLNIGFVDYACNREIVFEGFSILRWLLGNGWTSKGRWYSALRDGSFMGYVCSKEIRNVSLPCLLLDRSC